MSATSVRTANEDMGPSGQQSKPAIWRGYVRKNRKIRNDEVVERENARREQFWYRDIVGVRTEKSIMR